MLRWTCALCLAVAGSLCVHAQEADEAAQPELPSAEERALRRGVIEAQGSPVDIVRALERHLLAYPDTKRREEIEMAVLKTAIDLKDDERVLDYGQRVLDTGVNDIQIFDHVLPLLLREEDAPPAEKALRYARRYREASGALVAAQPKNAAARVNWKKRTDRGMGRALVFAARAKGNLGEHAEALSLAEQSYATLPTAEAAREIARWLRRLDRQDEAIAFLAEAFTIEDSYNNGTHRARDREQMGEVYRAQHGNEEGLGDQILAAYDRARVRVKEYEDGLAALAPNAMATQPGDFVLSGLDGASLALTSLRGKVVVVDFWATWCGPCRHQHPLYEEVMGRFRETGAVTFLSVNTDEDRSVVQPFLEENGWKTPVHFEDGLAGFLRISSIPTTLILDREGRVFSRMNGFVPETFVENLTQRVREALGAEDEAETASATVAPTTADLD
jgi:thiol-disulfide isomerase/thioredoxin